MGAQLAQHSAAQAWSDLKDWYRRNTPIALTALAISFAGVPFLAYMRGGTMDAVKDALGEVIVGSVLAPLSVSALAYLYFLLRAPNRLYALRIAEIKEHRLALGLSLDDLEPKKKTGRWRDWLFVYDIALIVAFLVALIGGDIIFMRVGFAWRKLAITATHTGAEAIGQTNEVIKVIAHPSAAS